MAVNHRKCDHPNTPRERAACRRRLRPVAARAPEPSLVIDPEQDARVWAEEGPVFVPDIRQPGIRAQVRRVAQEQEINLHRLLFAAGLHVIQRRGRTSRA
jgi:hypothetical protein